MLSPRGFSGSRFPIGVNFPCASCQTCGGPQATGTIHHRHNLPPGGKTPKVKLRPMTVRNCTISISQNQDRKYGLSASRLPTLHLCALSLQILNRRTTGPSVRALLALPGLRLTGTRSVKLGQTKRPQPPNCYHQSIGIYRDAPMINRFVPYQMDNNTRKKTMIHQDVANLGFCH